MGLNNVNKTINTDEIGCDGSLKVTLALNAAPDITAAPVDVVMVLDRSGSMRGEALQNLKAGANAFIDIISQASGGAEGQIGNGSRIGIVSFASTAVVDVPLTDSVAQLKAAVNALEADGRTNHGEAFIRATQALAQSLENQRIIVMFTDGNTTTGPNPSPLAQADRDSGILIYCIGLAGTRGVDASVLYDWASKPSEAFVAVTNDPQELEDLFSELAKDISKPGATNIQLTETVNPDFVIESVDEISKGQVQLAGANGLQWTIDSLGVTAEESAVLEFTIRHVAGTAGTKKVNQSIEYTDAEGNVAEFQDPEVTVTCNAGNVVYPEPCPVPVEVNVGCCSDTKEVERGDVYLDAGGSILNLDIRLKSVCPGKRVALAVLLTELDRQGKEHKRGMKTLVVPAQSGESCRDLTVKCIRFVLPGELDVSETPCGCRNFQVRVIANYIDYSYHCCGERT